LSEDPVDLITKKMRKKTGSGQQVSSSVLHFVFVSFLSGMMIILLILVQTQQHDFCKERQVIHLEKKEQEKRKQSPDSKQITVETKSKEWNMYTKKAIFLIHDNWKEAVKQEEYLKGCLLSCLLLLLYLNLFQDYNSNGSSVGISTSFLGFKSCIEV